MPWDSSHLLVADGFLLLYPREAVVFSLSWLFHDLADISCGVSARSEVPKTCVTGALSPTVIAVSVLIGMSPTKALINTG